MDQHRIFGLDAFRLLAMLGVITLHTLPIDDSIGTLLRLCSDWGVPFFFLVSGYFLAGKSGVERTFASIAKTVVIFCVASVLLFPLTVFNYGLKGAFDNAVGQQVLLRGTYFHLWFLSSMIIGLLFIAVSDYYRLRFLLPVVAIMSIAAYLLLGNYYPGSERFLTIARQFCSIPLIWIGMQLSTFKMSRSTAVLLLCGGLVLQIAEALCIHKFLGKTGEDFVFLIGTIPCSVGVFGIAANLPDSPWVRSLAAKGSRYALGIYIIHPYFIFLARATATQLSIDNLFAFRYGLSLLVFALCLFTLVLLDLLAPRLIDLIAGERRAVQAIDEALSSALPRKPAPVN
jgi:surface polysaccharide O-acyltransferase-like enzyme